MSQGTNNILKGLMLHFLHQGTVFDAIKQGRAGGVPMDLLESLPGIMFEITLAASDVYTGVRAFEDTVNEISKHASATAEEQRIASGNVARLMRVALEFLAEIEERRGSGSPIPDMTVPWFKYVAKDGQ